MCAREISSNVSSALVATLTTILDDCLCSFEFSADARAVVVAMRRFVVAVLKHAIDQPHLLNLCARVIAKARYSCDESSIHNICFD